MDITDYFPDDFEKLANAEYKVLPNLEAGPGEDYEDAGYKMVDMLASDLALDLTESDVFIKHILFSYGISINLPLTPTQWF